MGAIQDMNNRMKQNRKLRPSQREKFKNNREAIHSDQEQEQVEFPERSEFQVQTSIEGIRKRALRDKRKEQVLYAVILGLGTFALLYYGIKHRPKEKDSRSDTTAVAVHQIKSTPEVSSIYWLGKRFNPLAVPQTDLYYTPIIGSLDFDISVDRYYELKQNAVVENTTNVVFFDKECNPVNQLLPQKGHIEAMIFLQHENRTLKPAILYVMATKDSNGDGLINSNDKAGLYLSHMDGSELQLVTDRKWSRIFYRTDKEELYITFLEDRTTSSKDSLYGILNRTNLKWTFTNQQNKESLEEKGFQSIHRNYWYLSFLGESIPRRSFE
jgi:hypothetical protein